MDKTKWKIRCIDQCCEINFGVRIVKKDTVEGEYPVYGGGGATFTTKSYNREDAILISRFAMSKKCTRYVRGKFFLNDSGLTLNPKDARMLFDFLKWHIISINDKIYSLGRGVAQKNLDMNRFPLLSLYLPSLYEQKVIAAELDAIQRMIDGYKAQIKDFDELAKSIFLDMFGDVSINEKDWETTKLEKLGKLKNGLNYDKEETGNKIKIVGVGDFQSLLLLNDFSKIRTIELQNPLPDDYALRNGDIIFVRSNGNKKLVGRCMEVFPRDEIVTFGAFCIRFRKNNNSINNKYLIYLLTDAGFKNRHILKTNGIGIQSINQKILGGLPIPLPPLPLQQQFAAKVEAIEKQKELLRQQQADAETLMAERMQYYFS